MAALSYNWYIPILLAFVCDIFCDIPLCKQKVWCDECITASPDCAWCTIQDFNSYRCSTEEDLLQRNCPEANITKPHNIVSFLQNEPVAEPTISKAAVQIQPQHIKVKLRPGAEQDISLTYRVTRNLPVDMYFLMDFSTTMESKLKPLANLIISLATQMRNFTSELMLGFGSFLDKPVLPFHITTKAYLENPCILDNKTVCAPSYSFVHRHKLAKSIQDFKTNFEAHLNTSANWDTMEGGLDGLVQVAVCHDIIGWRNYSRRVIIYFSDAGYHFALDGKLAGIDSPNDGKCHLDQIPGKNAYTYAEYALKTDYPSLGHVAKILDDNKISTFYVVTKEVISLYEALSKMSASAETEPMGTTGKTIVDKIIEFYKKVIKKVQIEIDGNIPEDVMEKKIFTTCKDSVVQETSKCDNLEIGSQVDFTVKLKVLKCPEKVSDRNAKLSIYPAGLQDKLIVDVEYICDCDCQEISVDNSDECSNNGTFECGVCRCNEERGGSTCQCEKDDSGSVTNAEFDELCRDNSTSDGKLCSGRGTCECGICECENKYTGKYCQCDSSRCKDNCGAPTRGNCICDHCECNPGYKGDRCECSTSTDACMKDGVECSGQGRCVCNKCKCFKPELHTGDLCEICENCETQCYRHSRCGLDKYERCVTCHEFKDFKNINDTKCAEYPECQMNITLVDKFDEEPCPYYDKEDCLISFVVDCVVGLGKSMRISKYKECTNPPNPLYIALPILGGIIAVGILLLLIWKVLTGWYDKIEYTRFEKETSKPHWAQTNNPIYKDAGMTYQNPTCKGTIDDD